MLAAQGDHTRTPGCHSLGHQHVDRGLRMLYLSMYTSGICLHDLLVIYRHPLVLPQHGQHTTYIRVAICG
jgi:hypothetical protein